MAFITLSGFPSSGKSTRTQQIKAHLEAKIKNPEYSGPLKQVIVLSDDSLGISRTAYDDSRAEKPARGTLFTTLQRQMNADTVLIVDSLNYIKGFRYQMYCAAREMKLRTCTVYVVATPELCHQWNLTRPDDGKYSDKTLNGLIMRYEEPSSMVRWDSPLFTVLWTEGGIPGDQIWDAITKSNVKPPNASTLQSVKAPSDALHCLEQTTTSIVSAVMTESQGFGGPVALSVTPSLQLQINLPSRNITLSELQRYKRQFITIHKKAITLGSTEKGAVDWSEESVAHKFVTFLEEHLNA
ncbi:chromatin associated protein KTI12 [Pleurotus eryngii]|uniref:Chromatin associated protein KTI12 n=1 Tax=Pleurotus eryngii TaxID=5323 RepID=A0A9P6A8N1_PLEER|nr:chromatin associated protein KTI12 [Pleurotus eryngii]